jgi:hypothetical protein
VQPDKVPKSLIRSDRELSHPTGLVYMVPPRTRLKYVLTVDAADGLLRPHPGCRSTLPSRDAVAVSDHIAADTACGWCVRPATLLLWCSCATDVLGTRRHYSSPRFATPTLTWILAQDGIARHHPIGRAADLIIRRGIGLNRTG